MSFLKTCLVRLGALAACCLAFSSSVASKPAGFDARAQLNQAVFIVELSERHPGDKRFGRVVSEIWGDWVQAFATGDDADFLARLDEDARLYFPIGEGFRGWHRGRDKVGEVLAWENRSRGGAPLIIDSLFRVSHAGSTVAFEFSDHSLLAEGARYENGIFMVVEIFEDRLVEYREYLGSISPQLLTFVGFKYKKVSKATGTQPDFRGIEMRKIRKPAQKEDPVRARRVGDRMLAAIDVYLRTGAEAPMLELMAEDVAFWHPWGAWRGLTLGKENVKVLLTELSSGPNSQIAQIIRVTQNQGTTSYECQIHDARGDYLTRVAWSFDIVGGRVAAVRQYVGDASPRYLATIGAQPVGR